MVPKEAVFDINEDVAPQEVAIYFKVPLPFKQTTVILHAQVFSKETYGRPCGLVIRAFNSKWLGPRLESLISP